MRLGPAAAAEIGSAAPEGGSEGVGSGPCPAEASGATAGCAAAGPVARGRSFYDGGGTGSPAFHRAFSAWASRSRTTSNSPLVTR